MLKPAFPDGHFYSPVIEPAEVHADRSRIWPDDPTDPPGIDFRQDSQRALLQAVAPLAVDYAYPPTEWAAGGARFHEPNGMFEGLDARMLFCLLRHLRPARIIEVGSGFSTLLSADVNTRFLDATAHITCIEPYPPEFLREPPRGVAEIRRQKAQDGPLSLFEDLQAGDILFIDSSHVAKTGSDVAYLHLEVLPRLRHGVIVHVHDIFFPEDYPPAWVVEEQRSWNELYVVRAMLTFSSGFEVVFACHHAFHRMPAEIRRTFGALYGGGSLWIRRTVDGAAAPTGLSGRTTPS